jgi:hypothetical protein
MGKIRMTLAEVKLWGKTIGAVSWDEDTSLANFERGRAEKILKEVQDVVLSAIQPHKSQSAHE